MECADCEGKGYFEGKNGYEIGCLACNGSGSICDICGESCESGTNTCFECEEEG